MRVMALATGAISRDWFAMCRGFLEPRRSPSTHYRGFGGGFGGGTPVVSYAPRPMLSDDGSLVIIAAVRGLESEAS